MKAKDTVMAPGQFESYREQANTTARDYANATEGNFKQADIEAIYRAADIYAITKQAEISFTAGIKEVVEWGMETCPHCRGMTYHYKRVCDRCWQDKVKEWGIE